MFYNDRIGFVKGKIVRIGMKMLCHYNTKILFTNAAILSAAKIANCKQNGYFSAFPVTCVNFPLLFPVRMSKTLIYILLFLFSMSMLFMQSILTMYCRVRVKTRKAITVEECGNRIPPLPFTTRKNKLWVSQVWMSISI